VHQQNPGLTTRSESAGDADRQRRKLLRGRRWQWNFALAWLVLGPIAIMPIAVNVMPSDPTGIFEWVVTVLALVLAVPILPVLWLVYIAPLIDAGDPLLCVQPTLRMRITTDRLMPWLPLLIGLIMFAAIVVVPQWDVLWKRPLDLEVDLLFWAWIPVAVLLGWGISALVKRRAMRSIARRRLCPYCRYPRGASRVCTECGRELPRRRHGRITATAKLPRWLSWLPGNSPRAQEVLTHMTGREQSRVLRTAALWGLWGGATFALPVSFALVERSAGWIIIACVLSSIFLVSVVPFLRWQRRFLCSTTWARRQGITPRDLRRPGDRSTG
jgi:hypothetical protein